MSVYSSSRNLQLNIGIWYLSYETFCYILSINEKNFTFDMNMRVTKLNVTLQLCCLFKQDARRC